MTKPKITKFSGGYVTHENDEIKRLKKLDSPLLDWIPKIEKPEFRPIIYYSCECGDNSCGSEYPATICKPCQIK